MRTFFFSFIALLFTAGPCLSQSDSSFRRNEISANMLPVITVVTGGFPSRADFNLYYKRFANKALAFRTGAHVIINGISNFHEIYYYNILQYSDTMELREYSRSDRSPEFRLSLGLEYNWGKRKCTWYTGADLNITYRKSDLYRYAQVWLKDTNMYGATGMVYWYPSSEPVTRTWWVKEEMIGLGLTPFIGLKIPFGKNIGMSLQSGVDLNYRNADWDVKIADPSSERTYVYYEMEFSGIISEVALRFRF